MSKTTPDVTSRPLHQRLESVRASSSPVDNRTSHARLVTDAFEQRVALRESRTAAVATATIRSAPALRPIATKSAATRAVRSIVTPLNSASRWMSRARRSGARLSAVTSRWSCGPTRRTVTRPEFESDVDDRDSVSGMRKTLQIASAGPRRPGWTWNDRAVEGVNEPYYLPDLALIHHIGFGFHADATAPGILELLSPIRARGGLVVRSGAEAACSPGTSSTRAIA